VVTGDAQLDHMRGIVEKILQQIDEAITIHDFRMVQGKEHTNLIFDMALPSRLMQQRKQIKKQMDEAIAKETQGVYYTVVTFDIASFN